MRIKKYKKDLLKKRWFKNSSKSLMIFMLIFSMVVPTFAENNYKGKEEVVYAMLDANESINEVYVVNIFDKSGKIVDYGDYSKVRNMTTNDEILVDGNQITINNTDNKLYYEGTLKKNQLPWNIDIKYYIDNIEYMPEDIAGKSGALTIKIKIDENKDIDNTFYENYAIQALVTLDTNKVKDIISKEATMANVGKNKQLTYTILPGKGANKIKNGVSELKEATDKLEVGAKELEDGSANLENGVTSLKDGIIQIENALNELNSKSDSLTKGSAEFKSALMEVQSRLSNVSLQVDKTEELISASSQIKSSINELNSSIELLKNSTGYGQYKTTVKENGLDVDNLKTENTKTINKITGQIKGLTNSYNKVKDIPGYEVQAKELKEQINELTNIVKLLKGNNGAINGSEIYLNKVSESISQIYNGTSTLKEHYTNFDESINILVSSLNEMVASMPQLSNGINLLVEKYAELDNGINEYTDGVARIVLGYKGIVDGASTLNEGTQSIRNGSSLLYGNMSKLLQGTSDLYNGTVDLAEGTDEFKNRTSNIDTEVQNQVDEILINLTGDKDETTSFVSSENKEVQSVQFVIKTNDIKMEEVTEIKEKPVTKLTFWEKLLTLFGLV